MPRSCAGAQPAVVAARQEATEADTGYATAWRARSTTAAASASAARTISRAFSESGANRGRLRGNGEPGWRAFDGVGEAGVPAAELVGEVVVEHTGADLK